MRSTLLAIVSIVALAACGVADQDDLTTWTAQGKSETKDKPSVAGCVIVRYVCSLPDDQSVQISFDGPYLVDSSVAERAVFVDDIYLTVTDRRVCLGAGTYFFSLTSGAFLEVTIQQGMNHELFFQAEQCPEADL